jgi:hypothetical protein
LVAALFGCEGGRLAVLAVGIYEPDESRERRNSGEKGYPRRRDERKESSGLRAADGFILNGGKGSTEAVRE